MIPRISPLTWWAQVAIFCTLITCKSSIGRIGTDSRSKWSTICFVSAWTCCGIQSKQSNHLFCSEKHLNFTNKLSTQTIICKRYKISCSQSNEMLAISMYRLCTSEWRFISLEYTTFIYTYTFISRTTKVIKNPCMYSKHQSIVTVEYV